MLHNEIKVSGPDNIFLDVKHKSAGEPCLRPYYVDVKQNAELASFIYKG
jgi:hypothetical protein